METDEPRPPAPRRGRRPLATLALVALLATVAGSAALAFASRDEDRTPTPDATPSTSEAERSPRRWDARLADLVTFVETTRGLRFEHPVRTEFLADADFRAEVTDDAELSKEDRASLDHVAGLFRALGLAAGELDLRAAANQLSEEIVGVYDPVRDRILVRGDQVLPAMRPTIVHELTHALQAQHHDLERKHRLSGEETAFKALIEADAMRVQDAYIASLPPLEQDEVRRAADAAAAGPGEALDVPPILTELFSLPYVLGPPFVQALTAQEGPAAVDAAFDEPPTTEEHIVDPRSYLAGDRPAKVTAPALRKGEKEVGEQDDFGMLTLLLVLGERIPFSQAWTAAVGWKGDASVGYRTSGRDCIRVRTQLDTEGDAVELRDAVAAWGTGHDVEVALGDDPTVVLFSSCDPGPAAAGTDPARPRTFELFLLRAELLRAFATEGLDEPAAACAADTVLRDHDPALLLQVGGGDPADPRLVQLQRDVAATKEECRPG